MKELLPDNTILNPENITMLTTLDINEVATKPLGYAPSYEEFSQWMDECEGYVAFICDISPTLAKVLLEHHNHINRGLKRKRVDEDYAQAMKKQRWRRGTAGIGFDSQQQLTNGQHRLEGIVKSDVTVRNLLIVLNCDAESRATEDCGVQRSVADRLSLTGTPCTKSEPSVVRVVHSAPTICTVIKDQEVTRSLLQVHNEPLAWVMQKVPSGLLANCACRGALVRASYHVPRQRLEEFIQVVQSGVITRDEDAIGGALFRWLSKRTSGKMNSIQQKEIYAMTQNAIRHFVAEKVVSTLHPVEKDLYPLPPEMIVLGT